MNIFFFIWIPIAKRAEAKFLFLMCSFSVPMNFATIDVIYSNKGAKARREAINGLPIKPKARLLKMSERCRAGITLPFASAVKVHNHKQRSHSHNQLSLKLIIMMPMNQLIKTASSIKATRSIPNRTPDQRL